MMETCPRCGYPAALHDDGECPVPCLACRGTGYAYNEDGECRVCGGAGCLPSEPLSAAEPGRQR